MDELGSSVSLSQGVPPRLPPLEVSSSSGDRNRGVLALVQWEEEDKGRADGLGEDTASAIRSRFQAERHLLSPLVSSSVMNTCTKGHHNEIYIYNNHNYYSLTNFLFRGWSLAETTEQAKLLKQKVMVPPGRINSELQTSRCGRSPSAGNICRMNWELYGAWCAGLVRKFHQPRRGRERRTGGWHHGVRGWHRRVRVLVRKSIPQ